MDQSSKFYDERYEFDAPQQYIDFTNFQDDDNEDSFFDCRSEGQTQSLPDLAVKEKSSAPKTPNASRSASTTEPDTTVPEPDAAAHTRPENNDTLEAMICNSASDEATSAIDAVTSETEQQASEAPQPVSEPPKDELMETEEADDIKEIQEPRLTRSSRKGPLGSDGVFQQPPMRHSPRLAAIAKALNTAGGSRNSSSGFKGRRRSVSAGPANRAAKSKCGSGPLSVEERAHLAQFAQLADTAAYTRSRQCSSSGASKGTRPKTTKPVEFRFATDQRLKGAVKSTPATAAAPGPASAADFARTLRSCAAKNATSHAPRGPTKPQPFNLSEGKKALANDGDQQKNKFVSLAELNMKFHSHTPQRFRTKPKNEEGLPQKKVTQSSSSSSMHHTRPQSPQLSTRSRSRPVNYPTREQLEEQEMAEALKHQVKAHPLNPKIFEAPKLNVAVPVKPVTQPEPFNITAAKKELAAAASMSSFSDMLDDSLGCVPHAGVPPRQERVSTKVQPFSFDTRDQRMLRRKQDKIEEAIAKEKALAEFHALPMPVFEGGPKGLPSKKPPSATKPAPFELQIDKRAEARKLAMEREQEEREQREREMRNFRARSATVVSKDPFLPERSAKPLTDISAFELNTEKRSKDRHEFDLHLKQREDEIMAKKRQEEEQKAAEEEARVAEERKRNVHKAKPVPQYKPLQIHPSEKPVTAALSPKFATDGRLRSSRSRLNINASMNTTTTSSHSGAAHDSTMPR